MLSFAALKQFKSVKLVLISKKTSQILTATMMSNYAQALLNQNSASCHHLCRKNQYLRNSIDFLNSVIALKLGVLVYMSDTTNFFSRHIYQGHIKSMWYCRQKCRLFRAAWPVKSKTLCRPTLKSGCKKSFIRQYLMNSVL